jgi:hypothetical protein
LICSFNFLILLAVCLNISAVINIKIFTNCKQQTPSYKFTSHIAAFLSVVLITEMLEICIQTLYDQNVQLILKSYLPVVYSISLKGIIRSRKWNNRHYNGQNIKAPQTNNDLQKNTHKNIDWGSWTLQRTMVNSGWRSSYKSDYNCFTITCNLCKCIF